MIGPLWHGATLIRNGLCLEMVMVVCVCFSLMRIIVAFAHVCPVFRSTCPQPWRKFSHLHRDNWSVGCNVRWIVTGFALLFRLVALTITAQRIAVCGEVKGRHHDVFLAPRVEALEREKKEPPQGERQSPFSRKRNQDQKQNPIQRACFF